MISTRDLLIEASQQLLKAGVESPRLEARVLLAHAMGVAPDDIAAGTKPLREEDLRRFQPLLARRLAREPLAYITGVKEFWSLTFEVGPGVLIPRPETELMLEEVERLHPRHDEALTALDLGTGSGAILIAFLKGRPHASGVGVDVSEEALGWARKNAQRHGVASRSRFLKNNWAEGIDESFDLIFANPPYIDAGDMMVLAPEVGRHEPSVALRGGEDGLDAYRVLAPQILLRLKPGGRALVEMGLGQAGQVKTIFKAAGLVVAQILPDLAGIPRCAVVEAPIARSP